MATLILNPGEDLMDMIDDLMGVEIIHTEHIDIIVQKEQDGGEVKVLKSPLMINNT